MSSEWPVRCLVDNFNCLWNTERPSSDFTQSAVLHHVKQHFTFESSRKKENDGTQDIAAVLVQVVVLMVDPLLSAISSLQ